MAFQDDAREKEIRKIFGLSEPENRGRHDTDAILELSSQTIEFELKSAPEGKSITTARDVGFNHLTKWKTKHWLIGIYDGDKFSHGIYMPPRLLLNWIKEKEDYIRPDYKISDLLHKRITIDEMFQLIGKKTSYSYKDAKALQKDQLSKEEYLKLMDMPNAYSPKAMLRIVHDRVRYLILRGYTLNNPHIPLSVVKSGIKIEKDFKATLRKLIKAEIK